MKRFNYILLSAIAAGSLLTSCGGNSNQNAQTPQTNQDAQENSNGDNVIKTADGQITLSGSINQNVTWKDLGLPVDYIVEGKIYLEGNSLVTVEPGVTIMFSGTDGGIDVGENAGFKMQGTKDKPIVLTGPANNQNIGSWDGVAIRSNRADNILEYVEFKNGGSNVWLLDIVGKASVKNCTFDGATQNGISIGQEANLAAFENNTIKNCKEYPLTFYHNRELKNLGSGNVFENNGKQLIYCADKYMSDDNSNFTVHKAAVPYFFNDGLDVYNRVTVTFDPGVKIVLNRNVKVGLGRDAVIKLKGTAEEPIVFDGAEDKAGYWDGIDLNFSDKDCILENVNIINGGKDEGASAALFVGNECVGTLKNVSISKTDSPMGVIFDSDENIKKLKLENITVDNSPKNVKFLVNTSEVEKTGDKLEDVLK